MSSSSKQSKASKEGHRKFRAFVEAHAKAIPIIKNIKRMQQKNWKGVKDEPEKQKKMMLEFCSKGASQKSKLLDFWGRAAAANPAPKPAPIPDQVQPPVP